MKTANPLTQQLLLIVFAVLMFSCNSDKKVPVKKESKFYPPIIVKDTSNPDSSKAYIELITQDYRRLLEKLKTGRLNDTEKVMMTELIRAINPIGVKSMVESVVNSIKSGQPNTANEILDMLHDPRYPNEELLPYLQKQFPDMNEVSLIIIREELQKNKNR